MSIFLVRRIWSIKQVWGIDITTIVISGPRLLWMGTCLSANNIKARTSMRGYWTWKHGQLRCYCSLGFIRTKWLFWSHLWVQLATKETVLFWSPWRLDREAGPTIFLRVVLLAVAFRIWLHLSLLDSCRKTKLLSIYCNLHIRAYI